MADMAKKLENNEGKDFNEFRETGYKMVDYICEYMKNIKDRDVTTKQEPGFMAPMLESKFLRFFFSKNHKTYIKVSNSH
jgi:hypothetical protein